MSTLAFAVCSLVLLKNPLLPPTDRPNSVTDPAMTVSAPIIDPPESFCSRSSFAASGRSRTRNFPERTRRDISMSPACLPMRSRSWSVSSDRP